MYVNDYTTFSFPRTEACSGTGNIAEELIRNNYLVLFEGDRYCGILTPEDVIRRPRKLAIDCISQKEMLDAGESIFTAWNAMCRNHTVALPVVKDNQFIGVIEKKEIFRALTEKTEELSRQAEFCEKLKQEFIHDLCHEIRTPLNGILGFLQVLDDGTKCRITQEDMQKYAGLIRSNAGRFLRTMNGLIELAMLETGHPLCLCRKQVGLNDLLQELDRDFREDNILSDKQLELVCQKDEPLFLYTDREKLKHIFFHLLDNALKFSVPDSRIRFGIKQSGSDHTCFFVSNEGKALSASDRKTIFKCFNKGESSDSKEDGLGIGLSLVKHYAEALNGKVELHTSGKTTTFFVILPNIPVPVSGSC
ncbi:MAG: ATP-binding protein [Mangrovibacterium sp.]